MKRKQLVENGYKLHHVGSKRGYVSRKVDINELTAVEYSGKFGDGYTVNTPRWDTTKYCNVEYWVVEA